ncbi:hypothetical protein T10_10287 [Trichinella papuae]|uniref:Uncharacterized protein n=1 Tax=Trichinella papuae TaxID=268474 RepID=A0A0V1M6C1_9BILA|nr:hypothetical protein T10_10287 [Trichinella papuae]
MIFKFCKGSPNQSPVDNNINMEKLHLQNEKPIRAPMNQVRETLSYILYEINVTMFCKSTNNSRENSGILKFDLKKIVHINNFDAKISSIGKAQ